MSSHSCACASVSDFSFGGHVRPSTLQCEMTRSKGTGEHVFFETPGLVKACLAHCRARPLEPEDVSDPGGAGRQAAVSCWYPAHGSVVMAIRKGAQSFKSEMKSMLSTRSSG